MRRGFTLIELLVVISIIAVLSTVGFTAFSGIQAKARDAIRKNDLNTLATALEVYYEQNQKYIGTPGQDGSCTAGTDDFYNQIASKIDGPVPIDPKTGEKYLYTAENECQSYRFFAKLENCQGSAGNLCDYNYNFSVISDDLTIASAPGDTIASLPTPTPAPAWTENWDSLSGVQSRWSNIGSACYSVPQPGILDMVCQSAGLVSKQYFDKSQTIEVSGRVRAQPAQGSATDAYWGTIAIYHNDGSDTKYGTIATERNVPPFGGDHTSRVVSLTDDARPAILSSSTAWQWHDFKIVYSPDGSYRYYVDGTLRDTKTNALLPANPDIFVLCVSVGEATPNDGSAAQCQFGPITVNGVLITTPTPPPPSTVACADGTNDQVYSASMVGCNGSVSFDNASSLCKAGSHVCSLSEYLERGGKTTASDGGNRWLSTKGIDPDIKCSSLSCVGTTGGCWLKQSGQPWGFMASGSQDAYGTSCMEAQIGYFGLGGLSNQFGAVCCK